MRVRCRVFGCACILLVITSAEAAEPATAESAKAAMRKATEFFRTHVATEGGYLWRYSEDLARREGEGKAQKTTIWVQPPGTPSVGMVFLEAYEATGDAYYLDAAKDAAYALVRGQLRSGGWDYRIEFDPEQRRRYAYRVDKDHEKARNITTLDDDTTQAALRLLMRVDRALRFHDNRIHEAAQYAPSSLLNAQYPNGAWPQRYDEPADPAQFPIKRASYPETWSRSFPGESYLSHYTFNDNTIADTITTMLEAWHVYGDTRYKAAAERAGDFIILAQMPEPQPAWAQQYDADMHPAWARKFEPPAVTGGESQGVMRILLTLCRETDEKKFLEPLPRAIEYFRRSRLSDGRLARFYELRTNRPLYFTKDYELTYSDADAPTHYSFKASNTIEAIAAEYERLRTAGPAERAAATQPRRRVVTPAMERSAQTVIASMDSDGRWVEEGTLRYHGPDDPTRRVIDCRTFIENMRVLCNCLGARTESE